MIQTWHQSIDRLKQYISDHQDICITKDKLTIPEHARQDFYELFDEARGSFVTTNYPEMVNRGKALTSQYQLELNKAKQMVNAENIIQEEALAWFVNDPVDGLQKTLWEPMIELLKGIRSEEDIEEEYTGILQEVFDSYYFQTLENLLELSIINILESNQLFRVFVPTIIGSFGHAQGYVMHLDLKHVVPPEETTELSLKHRFDYCSFSVPDFIIYSKKLNKYVAVKARHHEAHWIALDPSPSRDWIPIDQLKPLLGNGYLLIFVADNPLDLALINDARMFNRPDMVIEFREKPGWYNDEEIDKIRQRASLLMPKSTTVVVSVDSVPDEVNHALDENIPVLCLGAEGSVFSSITDYLCIKPG